jgi:hypothetical protein
MKAFLACLLLVACGTDQPEAPMSRRYRTAWHTVAAACDALCAWDETCAPTGTRSTCALACMQRACQEPCTEKTCVDCTRQPWASDAVADECLGRLWERADHPGECFAPVDPCVRDLTP